MYFSALENPVALICKGNIIQWPELFRTLRRINRTLLKNFGPAGNSRKLPASGFCAGLEHLTTMAHKEFYGFAKE